ncbi:MAG: immune inhibitor A [Candidatus Cloacimonetes bacterium]|nr:immune inhibitor A [Candidatus Cloacimonadota bacterium]
MKKKILFLFIVIILIGSKFSFAETNITIKDTIFPPPNNFVAQGGASCIFLSWNAPDPSVYTLMGYNLYRDDIGYIGFIPIGPRVFIDELVIISVEYTYMLTALYEEGESDPVTASAALLITYIEDFELDDGGYTSNDPNGWQWGHATSGLPNANSGEKLWGTVLSGNYIDNANWTLDSPEILIPSSYPKVIFFHWYNTENSWDGGNVKISTDGGATWTVIIPEGGYPDDSIFALGGEPGYTANSGGWVVAIFDLNDYIGETVRLRWHFGSDSSVHGYPGWYIDDVISGIGPMPEYGTLAGIVTNGAGNSLDSVAVSTESIFANYLVYTNIDGEYSIDSIMTGTYDISFELEHYNVMVEEEVEIDSNQTTILNMIMTAPELIFTPTSFEFQLYNIGDIAIDTLNIANIGTGPVDFSIDIHYITNNRQDSILCVDRDGSSSASGYTDDWPYFEAALIAAGYTNYTYYEVVDISQDGPDLSTMQAYEVIIWFSGEAWGYYGHDCMTDNDEINLGIYLEGGGTLFLSAHDYLRASYPSAGDFSEGQFPYDYLGMRSVVQDNWLISLPSIGTVEGVDGSLAEGYIFFVQDILYIDQFTDHVGLDLFNVISPTPEGICANQYDSVIFKTVFTTASFAAITEPVVQKNLITDVINYLTIEIWYWVAIDIMSGTIAPSTTTEIILTVDTDGLDLGDYYADVIVNTDNPDIGQTVIPVHLELGVGVDEIQILSTKLNQNYPNPFSSSTTVSFYLCHRGTEDAEIRIYNIKGQLVKQLKLQKAKGKNNIIWDGKDENGNQVSSGLYFYQLKIEDEIIDTKKCLLLK